MNSSELQAAHEALRNRARGPWKPAPLASAGLEWTSEHFDEPGGAWQAFCAAAPRQGWVQWQSRQRLFEEGPPEAMPEDGQVLAAEAVDDRGDGLRLHLDDGGWTLWRYHHDPEGEGFLVDEVRHLVHGSGERRLRYRRYWRLDEAQGAVQVAAVLAGIDVGEEWQ